MWDVVHPCHEKPCDSRFSECLNQETHYTYKKNGWCESSSSPGWCLQVRCLQWALMVQIIIGLANGGKSTEKDALPLSMFGGSNTSDVMQHS